MSGTADRGGGRLGWFNATQFLGAMNDNVFKLLVVYALIASRGPEAATAAGALGLALLALPFLLFSAWAGVMADRFAKSAIIRWAKAAEIAIMAAGLGAFAAGSEAGICVALFLMAAQSAFFGPAKYGILPELVGREGLSRANGILQAFTYLAIICGTVAGPWLSQVTGRNYVAASVACVLIAVAGYGTSLGVPATPAAGSSERASLLFLRDVWRTLTGIRRDGYLLLAVLASAYFSLLGAFMQINLIPYAMQELGLSQEAGSYLFLFGALGIGAGSLFAGRLSGRNVELGVVPIGAFGLTLASLALGRSGHGAAWAWTWVFAMGMSAGLFIVPITAWMQFRSPEDRRGAILAASGFLGWVGVVAAAALLFLCSEILEIGARRGFTLMGVMTLVLTVGTLRVLPDFLLRFLAVAVTRLCYRMRVIGVEHVPLEGPALMVCNHVSWMDSLLLLATQQRRIRFLAERGIYEHRAFKPLMRLMGVIPISGHDAPKRLLAALKEARAALDDGYLVCIFGEGAVTRSGNLMAFKSGFERVVAGTRYPIIPVYLGGAWGSIFSYAHGTLLSRWPISFPYPVTVLFGKPLPADSPLARIREAVLELACDYFNDRKPLRVPLVREFAHKAHLNWARPAVSDTTGRSLSYGRTLAGAIALAGRLRAPAQGQEYVGILLPPGVGGVLANLAVGLLGRVPVNLNYTTSEASLRSAVAQCGIRCVVTSRTFLEKLGRLPVPDGAVFLEDLLGSLTAREKRAAWMKAKYLPSRLLVRAEGFSPDSLATVIFSSGSSGEPKGVMLSHHNVMSNIESLRVVFRPSPDDVLCAVLPFFHSFGYTATLWFPLLSGFRSVYHANPLDAGRVARIAREQKATLLFATPSFLSAYTRKAEADDFATLRMVVAGAEKLRPQIAEDFRQKFGLRVLEGYGATELAPVAALNVPDVEIGGVKQLGGKTGTVGHPVPGVVVRIVDPDSRQPLPFNTPGLMLIKGPNVMIGYLGRPDLTAEALQDGWYNTGDIASMDPDGFVTVVDRLSRFSKIGGEMVPHTAVEEVLQRGLGLSEPVVAVAGVPDPRKGERLVVLYTDAAGPVEKLRDLVAASALPNLWKPPADSFRRIEAIPLLGSGKLDLKAVKALAASPQADSAGDPSGAARSG